MLVDIVSLIFLCLEVFVLVFFIVYIGRYYKQYQEKVDPYTRATLLLLSLSFLFQFLRIPVWVVV
jgi:hypothetical protein